MGGGGLSSLGLTLSPTKSKVITFKGYHDLQKRYPIYWINGITIEHGNSFVLLGVTIDRFFNWFPISNSIKSKLLKFHQTSYLLSSKYWGINSNMLKSFYLTIIEWIISYGVGIWGGNLIQKQREVLNSIQRFFLLRITRSCKTISNDTLHVIMGISPMDLTIDYEYRKTNILQLKNIKITEEYFPNSSIPLLAFSSPSKSFLFLNKSCKKFLQSILFFNYFYWWLPHW